MSNTKVTVADLIQIYGAKQVQDWAYDALLAGLLHALADELITDKITPQEAMQTMNVIRRTMLSVADQQIDGGDEL